MMFMGKSPVLKMNNPNPIDIEPSTVIRTSIKTIYAGGILVFKIPEYCISNMGGVIPCPFPRT